MKWSRSILTGRGPASASACASSDSTAASSCNRCSAGMPGRSQLVVLPGSPGQLDVRTQDPVHRVALGNKLGQPGHARPERGPVEDVEPARVERVAAEQQPRGPVVQGDVGGVVPRDRDDVQDPVAEVELDHVVRPVADPEVRRHVPGRPADDVLELGIATDVIAVAVRVRHDQPLTGQQPVDDRPELRMAGPGVEEEGPLGAEQQIDERPLEVGPQRLPDDHGAVVVPVHLVLGTRGIGAVVPLLREARHDFD